MSVPVHRIRMSSPHLCIDRIAGKPVLPEFRLQGRLEMRLIPHVSAEFSPIRMPWMHVGLVDSKTYRIDLRNEHRLSRNRSNRRIYRLTQPHIIVSSERIVIWFEINIIRYIEIHTASDSIDHKTVSSWFRILEVYSPHIRPRKILLSRLVRMF